ncbi:hypothetical protein ASA1KI_10480 [Opitutales bacterium ASA1]|uniref:hypothetical protein n=1 Tax=Congregicoccus parvus TaxID=3081749 RepID=UPI002B2FB0A5|nr:hypothetical protein ASA1KI_10480 [Opitutales bacterium ASA1]
MRCPLGGGAPLPSHAQVEGSHVVPALLSGETHELRPEDLVRIGSHLPRTFHNRSSDPVDFLAVGTPAVQERFFREVCASARSVRL